MLVIKLIFITLFIFAFVQCFVDKLHLWLEDHQGILTALNIILIITFSISFFDIINSM